MEFSDSLKKNREFQQVYRQGKSYANKYLVMYVSKKVGNSVIRHHLTRLIREAYRLHEGMFNSGLDIVVVARVNAKSISYAQVESALLHLGRLQGIIKQENN